MSITDIYVNDYKLFDMLQYHMWGAPAGCQKTFLMTGKEMFKKGGINIFLLGSSSTLARDIIFGGVFAMLRHQLMKQYYDHTDTSISTHRYIINMISACCATILSSPLNYVRNIQYACNPSTNTDKMTIYRILKSLWIQTQEQIGLYNKLSYLQRNLRIGWGTARVGCGMAFSEQIYTYCIQHYDD